MLKNSLSSEFNSVVAESLILISLSTRKEDGQSGFNIFTVKHDTQANLCVFFIHQLLVKSLIFLHRRDKNLEELP